MPEAQASTATKSHKPADHAKHGRWVKTSTPPSANAAGAFKAPDGKFVGLYQAAHRPSDVSASTDAVAAVAQAIDAAIKGGSAKAIVEAPVCIPAHVVYVRPTGEDLMAINADGNSLIRVTADPAILKDLESCVVPDDLPNGQKTAHLFPAKA